MPVFAPFTAFVGTATQQPVRAAPPDRVRRGAFESIRCSPAEKGTFIRRRRVSGAQWCKLTEKVKRSWDGAGVEVLRTSDFESTRLRRDGIYAVCFGATWCRPTRGFVPKFVARNGRLPARLAIADITEWNDPLWDSFHIRITPTILVFRDGTPVGRFDGRRFVGLKDSDLDRMTDLLRRLSGPGPPTPSATPP